MVAGSLTNLARVFTCCEPTRIDKKRKDISVKPDEDIQPAIQHFKQAIAKFIQAGQHETAIHQLNGFVFALVRTGHFRDALLLGQQAFDLSGKHLSADEDASLQALINLGSIQESMGNFEMGEQHLKRAVLLTKELRMDMPEMFVVARHTLGTLYGNQGNYAAAEPLLLFAKRFLEENAGLNPVLHGQIILSLGANYHYLGLLQDAFQCGTQAISLYEELLVDSIGDEAEKMELYSNYADSLLNYAAIQHTTGDLQGALNNYQKCIDLLKEYTGFDQIRYAQVIHNLAEVYRTLENYEEAIPLAEKAYSIRKRELGSEHPLTISTLNNLAGFYSVVGRAGEGQALIERCLKQTAGDSSSKALYLNNLAGFIEDNCGDYERAKTLFQKALDVAEKVQPTEFLLISRIHNNYAWLLHEKLSLYSEAESLYLNVVNARQKILGEYHLDVANVQVNLAVLYADTGRHDQALALLKKASKAYDNLVPQISSIGSENDREKILGLIRWHTALVLSLVARKFPTDAHAVQYAFELTLQRKAIGLEISMAHRMAFLCERYSDLQPDIRKLTLLSAQIVASTLSSDSQNANQGQCHQIEDWVRERNLIQRQLAQQIPELEINKHLKAVSREVVASEMPTGSHLIEMIRIPWITFRTENPEAKSRWDTDRYIAFVMPQESPDDIRMVDLGSATKVDQLVSEFRKDLNFKKKTASGSSGNETSSEPQKTDQVTITPLSASMGKLFSGIKPQSKILISPDGELAIIPFELLEQKSGRRLIEEYKISYLTSGRDVLRFERPDHSTGKTILIVDPDFDLQNEFSEEGTDVSNRSQLFVPLPGTAIEAQQIRTLLGETTYLSGRNALKTWIISVRSPRILHIATHGYFYPQKSIAHKQSAVVADISMSRLALLENPLFRSGMALAGANSVLTNKPVPEDVEDGLLTSEDIAQMNLTGTSLVVASACDTGIGDLRNGEGVIGLRRAFILAGTETVVISLWRVSDLATAILMQRFYQNLLQNNKSRQESLREAQLFLRDATMNTIRGQWFCDEIIEQLSVGRPSQKKLLLKLRSKSDDYQPFEHPQFWGSFICLGNPLLLPQ